MREEHDARVHDLVVPQVLEQRSGHARVVRPRYTAVPATRAARGVAHPLEELFHGHRPFGEPRREQPAPAVPRRHHREHRAAIEQREPAATRDLQQARAPEAEVHDEEAAGHRQHRGQAPLPAVARDDGEQDRREHHVGRHRHAVGRRQSARRCGSRARGRCTRSSAAS